MSDDKTIDTNSSIANTTPHFEENGFLHLPNGKSYKISEVKIGGKKIDWEAHREKIQDLVIDALNKSDGNFTQVDIHKILIQAIGEEERVSIYRGQESSQHGVKSPDIKKIQAVSQSIFGEKPPVDVEMKRTMDTVADDAASVAADPIQELGQDLDPVDQAFNTPSLANPVEFKERVLTQQYQLETEEVVAKQIIEREDIVYQDLEHVEKQLEQGLDDETRAYYENQRYALYSYLEYGYRQAFNCDKQLPDVYSNWKKGNVDENYLAQLKADCKSHQISSWLTSNYNREDLLDRKIWQGTLGQEAGWKRYISAPVNLRFNSIETANGTKKQICRLGVMSDMRNGYTSLAFLKGLEKGANDKIDALISRIQDDLRKIVKTMTKEKQNIEDYQEYFAFSHSLIRELKSWKIYPEMIVQATKERRLALEKQMAHLVAQQAKHNPELVQKAVSSGNFDLLHVSLLNQNAKECDGRGWRKDEELFMTDMNEIFKEFRENKSIRFDSDGAFYMDENTLHLPKKEGVDENKNIQIRSYFLNVSIQGIELKQKNEGTQKAINDENLAQFLSDQGELGLTETFSTNLNKDKTKKHNVVASFLKKLLDSDSIAVSTGCMSAKDRTGRVAHLLVHQYISEQLKGKNPFFVIDEYDDIQRRVARENNMQRDLKVHLFHTDTFSGSFRMLMSYKDDKKTKKGKLEPGPVPPAHTISKKVNWLNKPAQEETSSPLPDTEAVR